jgi:hypothetical protein
MIRLGPERTATDYDEPHAAAKRVLLARINRDRHEAGVPPLAYERRAALAGDRFCLGAALDGAWGHWDTAGRAPYLRWALAGGVDYHSENVAAYSVSSGRIDRPLEDILLQAHDAMMAERPPQDGHRRTILDPLFTHVGIGLAAAGGEFRTSQEFTRVVLSWVEMPATPLRRGDWARFGGEVPPDWEVGLVEIRFEPPPRPVTLLDLRRRGSYRLPGVVRSMRPRLPEGGVYDTGGRGDFPEEGGRFSLSFPLAEEGHYFVVTYVRPRGSTRETMSPATTALVVAGP